MSRTETFTPKELRNETQLGAMSEQQNPERGPRRPVNHGHRTATPDAPHLPRQRHETPARPPANATPPGGRPATAPRPTPPGGVPASARPAPAKAPRPTQMMPGPGTPDAGNARSSAAVPPTSVSGPPGPGGGKGGRGSGGNGSGGNGPKDGGATTKQEKPTSDLQFNKIVAGAGAAIVTAVLGSFLGAVGTILGAALGSIITTLATTIFQKSIETTRAQVTDKSQKLRERRTTRAPGAAAWQAAAAENGNGVAGPGSQETVRIDPSAVGATTAAPASGSRWTLRKMNRKQVLWSAIAALLAFGLAMFLVTGIEWVKGSTITGGNSGTSIGNVANGSAAEQRNTDDDNANRGTSTSESATSTSESTSDQSDRSTGTSQDDGNSDSDSTATSNPLGGLNNIVPTQGNESGQLQSGQDDNGNSGGGADSSN